MLCAIALITINISADAIKLDKNNTLVFSRTCTEIERQATCFLCIHLKEQAYDIPLIKSFLKNGADVNARVFNSDEMLPDTLLFAPLKFFSFKDKDKYSEATRRTAISVLGVLLEAGADPISRDCGYVFFALLLQSLEDYLYEHIFSHKPKAELENDPFFIELRKLTVATHFRMIQDHNPAYTPELQASLARYYPYFYSAVLPDAVDNPYILDPVLDGYKDPFYFDPSLGISEFNISPIYVGHTRVNPTIKVTKKPDGTWLLPDQPATNNLYNIAISEKRSQAAMDALKNTGSNQVILNPDGTLHVEVPIL